MTVDATTNKVTTTPNLANAATFSWKRDGTITHVASGLPLQIATANSNITLSSVGSGGVFTPELLYPVLKYTNASTGAYNDIPGPIYVSGLINSIRGWFNAYGGISANTTNGWRWGFGMFAILIPVCITPALAVLFWGDRKAKKLGGKW